MHSSTEILQLSPQAADLVITYANFKSPAYLRLKTGHLSATFAAASQANYQQLPFLVNADQHCSFRARTMRFLKGRRNQVLEIDSWDAIFNLVKTGQGVALLPTYLVAEFALVSIYSNHHFNVPYSTFTSLINDYTNPFSAEIN